MFAVILPLPLLLLPLISDPVQQPNCAVEPIALTAIEAPIQDGFNQRIGAYMQVHQDIEWSVMPHRLWADPEEMVDALESFQTAIREARADARQGTIFTAEVGALIRTRIERRLAACNDTVEDVLAFINEERLKDAPAPRMYEPFPWSLGSAMWPTLLPALPSLPAEMQYRFADRDLVLIDMHADLVVDILTDALPAPGHAGHATHRR
jgi:hypothetical protein